jgi:hypothetical protein
MNSDDVLARAEAALQRHGGVSRLKMRSQKRRFRNVVTKIKRIVILSMGIVLAAIIWGVFIGPLNVTGALIALLALMMGAAIIAFWPHGPTTSHDLPDTELAQLPLQTESWLAEQRKLLPPPAQRLADGIGVKLEILSDQLRTLDEKEPAAQEVRRLVANDLPELINGYGRVPQHLRKEGLDGLTPDKQLVDGLLVVDSELKRMSEQIARGDLTQLATQTRYLEIKYQGDGS